MEEEKANFGIMGELISSKTINYVRFSVLFREIDRSRLIASSEPAHKPQVCETDNWPQNLECKMFTFLSRNICRFVWLIGVNKVGNWELLKEFLVLYATAIYETLESWREASYEFFKKRKVASLPTKIYNKWIWDILTVPKYFFQNRFCFYKKISSSL